MSSKYHGSWVARDTRQHNISGVPVVEGDNLVGIVTGRDIVSFQILMFRSEK